MLPRMEKLLYNREKKPPICDLASVPCDKGSLLLPANTTFQWCSLPYHSGRLFSKHYGTSFYHEISCIHRNCVQVSSQLIGIVSVESIGFMYI